MLDLQQLQTNTSPEGTGKDGHRSDLSVLNPICEMFIFSSLSPSGRGRSQQQAGLKSDHEGAGIEVFTETAGTSSSSGNLQQTADQRRIIKKAIKY